MTDALTWASAHAQLLITSITALLVAAHAVVAWTATTKDDEIVDKVDGIVKGGISKIEALLNKDINGDGKVG